MDRTRVKMTTLKAADEAFCLDLTVDGRVAVLEDLNRRARQALGYRESRLIREIRIIRG